MARFSTTVPLPTVMAVLTVIAHVVVGVDAQKEAQRIPTGTGSIAGRVIDRASDRPLAQAMVTLQSTDGGRVLRTTTAGDGRYLFEGIGPGEYRVTASHDGYVTQEFGRDPEVVLLERGGVVHPGRIVFALAVGQARDAVDVALDRAGSLAGRVTRADGSPVKGAVVIPLLIRDEGGFTVNPSAQVQTGERGDYAIRDVRPGAYQLSVNWIAPEMVKPRGRPTYYPGTNIASEAVAVHVRAGSTTGSIDVVLQEEEVYRLSGHVLRGSIGGRLEGYLISPSRSTRPVTVAGDGAFDIPYLQGGRYTFWARLSADEHSEAASITVDLMSDVKELLVPLAPTGEIAGRVVTDDGAPLVFAGAEVVADLVDETGRQLDSFPRDRSVISDDGSFHIKGLFGTRVLRLIGTQREVDQVLNGKTPIQTITFGGGERVDGVTIVAVRR
jgi:Carboxypeptidase regulatory-like domain